jgi:hypothetical protein
MRSTDSFADVVRNTLAAGVTFRRYGELGELRRPMIHRFPAKRLKCDCSVADLIAESIRRSNPLLQRLMQRGKVS